jgi:hypothetical protein
MLFFHMSHWCLSISKYAILIRLPTSIFVVCDTKFCSIPVTCTIMQKNGAGLHTASSCFWDNSTDGSCTVRWENKTMYCIVSVFGLAI